jgi:hypothetical protein
MAKNESTAINDLIHLVQGKIIDHGSEGSDEPLFVTAPRLAPTGPLPPPLPRRRAPNATPPAQLVAEYDDDDSETQVDPHALLAWGNPGSLPQPVLPQYAFQTPAPLPPVPARNDATERVERYAPVPTPAWAAPQPRPAPVPPTGFDVMETVRVAALPPPAEHSRSGALARYLVPAGAAARAIGGVAAEIGPYAVPLFGTTAFQLPSSCTGGVGVTVGRLLMSGAKSDSMMRRLTLLYSRSP